MSEVTNVHRNASNVPDLITTEDKQKESIAESSAIDKDADQPIAPDQFDEKYLTTKWEIRAYYAWVINWTRRMVLNTACA